VFVTTFLCWFIFVGQVATEVSQPATPPENDSEVASQVEAIVARLNDDDLATRQQAEKELLDLGPDAIESLPPIRDRMPQELKLRLQRVREMLEKQAAEQATQATTVTLNGSMKLSAAIAEIQKQTGNKLLDFRGQFGQNAVDPELQLELTNAQFWEAIDVLMDKADLQLYPYSGQLKTLAFVQRDEEVASAGDRVSHSGLFRVEPTRVEAIRDLRTPNVQGMRLTLEFAWEPRITPIAITHPLSALTATGDDGQPLSVTNPEGTLDVAVISTVGAVDVDLPFDLPSRDVREIKELTGTITVLLPGREVAFSFDDLADANNVPQRRAGVTVVLQGARQNVDVQEVRILVQFDEASGALESHRGWIYNNDAYLLGPNDERLDYSSFETTRQQENEIGMSYKFAGPEGLKGYRFVYKSPAAIVRKPVSYQLKNIPLP
jgi:hypothetical protein